MIFFLFIKMKEESVRHREMENQRHREVSTLKKQTRKNESKIKSLEAEKRMKELALKRKNEEVKKQWSLNNLEFSFGSLTLEATPSTQARTL
jgi:hypothetical protein